MRSSLLILCLVAVLCLPMSAAAATIYWTSSAAGCNVAPGSPATEDLSGVGVTYAAGSTSTASISLVCNVVPTDGTNSPAWTTLTLGYSNVTAAGQVFASVSEADGTGVSRAVSCVAQNPATPTSGTVTCTLGTFAFDFTRYVYTVGITIGRSASTQHPQANLVSLN